MPAPPPASRSGGSGDTALFAAAVLLFLSFYALLVDGHFCSIDEVHLYQTADSILRHGDLSVRTAQLSLPGVDGKLYSYKAIGASLAALPFNLAGIWLDTHLGEPWHA